MTLVVFNGCGVRLFFIIFLRREKSLFSVFVIGCLFTVVMYTARGVYFRVLIVPLFFVIMVLFFVVIGVVAGAVAGAVAGGAFGGFWSFCFVGGFVVGFLFGGF